MSAELSRDAHLRLKSQLSIPHQAFIDGRYLNAVSNATFDNMNPATGELLSRVSACDREDVDAAVASARAAFENGSWAGAAPVERKKTLQRFADLIDKHSHELALLESLDTGKPIRDALNVDIPKSADAIRWSAEAIDKINSEVLPAGPSAAASILREPMGVVAAVLPWNFPLMMAAWKIGPALVTGNSLILKPAEQSPLTTIRVAALAAEAGIPPGVLNVVPGMGETVGRAIGLHPDIDCVAFTGSTEIGKLFLRYSADSNMKRISLECGGKSPALVMSDANIDSAANDVAWGIFFNQGECCDALSRVVVHESVHDEFLEKVIAIGRSIKIGDPLDPATEMGAIIDKKQMKRIMGYIDLGRTEGARLVSGGKQVLKDLGGCFVEPTVFDEVKNHMKISQDEIFGPVACAISVADEESAIRVANDTRYGLVASVFTQNLNRAYRLIKSLRAGAIWVNCFDAGDMTAAHGGFKESGIGRDRSLHSLEKYTELKTVWIKLS